MRRHQKTIKKLIDTYFTCPLLSGAEIGVWCGETSAMLLKTYPNLHLWMIDAYQEEGMCRLYGKMKPTMSEALKQAFEATDEWHNRRSFLIQDSMQAAELIPNYSLDFVFIDACHYYLEAKRDIETWSKKVVPSGLVMGHDYNPELDKNHGWGVTKAVDEYAVANGIEISVHSGTVWSFLK